jgi:deoxyxylulose-5-phosphate synthase
MNERSYQELFQFFAGYFHEDWQVDALTADDVVKTFTETHSRDECRQIADLVDAFAAATPDDEALEKALFSNLGCYYVPAADGRSVRELLQQVSRALKNRLLAFDEAA